MGIDHCPHTHIIPITQENPKKASKAAVTHGSPTCFLAFCTIPRVSVMVYMFATIGIMIRSNRTMTEIGLSRFLRLRGFGCKIFIRAIIGHFKGFDYQVVTPSL